MVSRIAHDRPRRHSGDGAMETTILDAAEALLAERPLHEVSVAQIIERAGVARASFYFYFSSKFAVVAGLLTRAATEIFASLEPWVQTKGHASEAVFRSQIASSAEIWERYAPVMRAAVENLAYDAELQQLWRSVVDPFVDQYAALIDAEREAGRAPAGVDSRTLAVGLAWATERILYISTIGIDDRLSSPASVADMLTTLWMGAIYGPAKSPRGAAKARTKARPDL
jgi:AcrR family transcriptional regulator